MAVLPIRIFGDPALRQAARPVKRVTDVHRRLIDDMFDTMRDAPGVGLAGPQVGVMERIFVWELEDRHGAVIDPAIVWRSEATEEAEEGCLSLPGLLYPVARNREVKIQGRDEQGAPAVVEAQDLLARIFQHEIDHLDGVLFIDRLPEAMRREALARLRDQALGLAPAAPARAAEVAPEDAL